MKLSYWLFFYLCLASTGVARTQGAADTQSPPDLVILNLKWSKQLSQRAILDSSKPVFDSSAKEVDLNNSIPTRNVTSSRYAYAVKLRNEGEKKIKGIVWEYIFVDPQSKEELGRHQFVSNKKIGENQSVTLSARTVAAPSIIVSAKGLEKDERSPYLERVDIKCVLYSDDSLWRHPGMKEHECAKLFEQRKGNAK